MPPKQATLALVDPAQTTLGRFFDRPAGAKGRPTQQRLAFSTREAPLTGPGGRAESSRSGARGITSSDSGEDYNPVFKVTELDAKEGVEPDGSVGTSPIRKRLRPNSTEAAERKQSKPEDSTGRARAQDLNEIVQEPLHKRPRRIRFESPSASATGPGKDLPKRQKADQKEVSVAVKREEDGDSPEDNGEAMLRTRGDQVDLVNGPVAGRGTPPDTTSISSEHTQDEQEAEFEVSEEEEKVDVVTKARERVRSTLKASGKDPYPDWKALDPVPYAALCTTFSLIELTTKRLAILSLCSQFLRQVLRLTPGDLLPTVQLMINKLAADAAGIELGIGESLIMKAIGETTGRSLAVIKADHNEIGDLGLVAAKSRSNQPTMFKPKPLTVRGVHEGLMTIATLTGNGAQSRKIAGIKKLLSAADAQNAGKDKGVDISKDKGGPSEAKFLIRFLEGKLRLGLAEKTVLVALAQAMVAHEAERKGKTPTSEQLAEGEAILKAVYSELPSYEVIIPAMLEYGLTDLPRNCKLQPGVPLKPMLAKPTRSITEVLNRFENQNFTCEYKYDGERAQIHFVSSQSAAEAVSSVSLSTKSKRGLSAIFSRNSEDLSKKYPDVLEKLDKWVKPGTTSFVLDCETVAWDVSEKQVLPFQQLQTRKRKDVRVEDVKVKVCVFAFDLLYLNGEPTVHKSLRNRRELLHGAFEEVEGEFTFARYLNTSNLEEISAFLEESVKASCEGLMVKMLDGEESGYEPSKRSRNWLKIKKDYLSGLGDSLDLVVVGAYFGKGRRTSVYGAFLLACYNTSSQTYETICNIGTGFSDALLDELHAQLSEYVIDKPKPFYSHSNVPKEQPDVWFEPRWVWEVKTADLTLSPRYKAAALLGVDPQGHRGVSLRFPRFIKRRDDKKPEQATGSRMVAEMYRKQESVSKSHEPAVDDDFEY